MRSLAPTSLATAFVILALPSAVTAQKPQHPDVPAPTFNGTRSVAGFRTVEALSGEWQVVDFFAIPNSGVQLPNGRPWTEYVARRRGGAANSEGDVSWTSSRDCRALYNTMVWISALVAPRIEIPGVSPSEAEPAGRRPITITADGVNTTVWGRGTQPDHTLNTRIEMSSNGGLIAQFGRGATENLAPCWRSQVPTMGVEDGERG
jgi:hypothetical protein